jgi:hypothetical protein
MTTVITKPVSWILPEVKFCCKRIMSLLVYNLSLLGCPRIERVIITITNATINIHRFLIMTGIKVVDENTTSFFNLPAMLFLK